MNKVDWLGEILDELHVFALQSQDEAMKASVENIKEIYTRERYENACLSRMVSQVH